MLKKNLTALLIMVSIVSIAKADPNNLVRDPGFEDPTWDNGNSWISVTWGDSSGYWGGNGPSAPGSNCIALYGKFVAGPDKGQATDGTNTYLYEPNIPIIPGATYTFSFDVFTWHLTSGGYWAAFRYYDAGGNQLGQVGPNGSLCEVLATDPQNRWYKVSVTVTVPSNAVNGDVAFIPNAPTNSHDSNSPAMFIDNVSLVQTPALQNWIAPSSITATASSSYATLQPPSEVINGDGLYLASWPTSMSSWPAYLHIANGSGNSMWMSAAGGGGITNPNPGTIPARAWIRFDFDQSYALGMMWVWNFNQAGGTARGLRNVTIQYTNDLSNWTTLVSNYQFAQGLGVSSYAHNIEINFGGVNAKAVVISVEPNDPNANWGDTGPYYGLSEVKFGIYGTTAPRPILQAPIAWQNITPSQPTGIGATYGVIGHTVDNTDMSCSLNSSSVDSSIWTVLGLNSLGGPFTSPSGNESGPAWIRFDFDKVYSLGTMWVWNDDNYWGLDRGFNEVAIEYTADGSTWHLLGNADKYFAAATGNDGYAHNTEIDFGGVNAKSVVLTAISNIGYGSENYYGLSKVRFGQSGTDVDAQNNVLLWNLDATSGTTAADSSVYGNNGTVSGNAVWTAGIVNNCLQFDGTTSAACASATALPTSASSAWTINAYVYMTSQPANPTLIAGFGSASASDTHAQRYIAYKNSHIYFWGNGSDIDSGTVFDLNKWQMITVTYSGSPGNLVSIYKNGNLLTSQMISPAFASAASAAKLAPVTTGYSAFVGKIDAFGIWNYVLTQTQIDGLSAVLPAQMVLDWNFDAITAGSGQTAISSANITTTASSAYDDVNFPINALTNGNGLTGDYHENDWAGYGMFITAEGGGGATNADPATGQTDTPAWFEFAFDKAYNLGVMKVWNYNQLGLSNRGLRDVYIWYSPDGTNYTHLMNGANNIFTLARGDETSAYLCNNSINFSGISAQYVVIAAVPGTNDIWGAELDGSKYYGLSAVRFGISGTSSQVVADASGNGNTGTLRNFTGTSELVSGVHGNALHFKSFEFVDCAMANNLPVRAGQAWSMNMWLKQDANEIDQSGDITTFGIMGAGGKANGGDQRWFCYWNRSGYGYLFGDNATNLGTNLFSLSGKWHMWTVTYDGSSVNIYADGHLITSQPWTFLLDAWAGAKVMGVSPWNDTPAAGTMDDFSIWQGALTPAQISAMAMPADINHDGTVNFKDFAILAAAWMSTSSSPNWNANANINWPNDNVINMLDLEVFAQSWLQ